MKTEFEIVFMKINREDVVEKIKSLGWICTKNNTLMKRVIFEKQNWDKNSFFRVRDEWDKITTTYKEISNWELNIHSVKELETVISDFEQMVQIYEKAWLLQKAYQETYREIWEINWEIEFMIDLWPGLNSYIEIEWETEEIVKKYSKLLWFNYNDWVFWTVDQIYKIELWLEKGYINKLKEITFENPPLKNK